MGPPLITLTFANEIIELAFYNNSDHLKFGAIGFDFVVHLDFDSIIIAPLNLL